jgi:hypothetical protein
MTGPRRAIDSFADDPPIAGSEIRIRIAETVAEWADAASGRAASYGRSEQPSHHAVCAQ